MKRVLRLTYLLKKLVLPSIFLFLTLVSACGGGGSESGSDSKTTPPDETGAATVTGTITLPLNLTGKLYYIAVDTNNNGDDGQVTYTKGTVSGTAINYSIAKVPAGTYNVYCVVYKTATVPGSAATGDYVGFYNGTLSEAPNAVVPASGTVNFDFSVMEYFKVVTFNITDGTAVNKYGIPRLWEAVSGAENVVASTRTEFETYTAKTCYYYFGDDNVLYCFSFEDSKWYGMSASYTFNASDKTFTLSGISGVHKIVVSGTGATATMMNSEFNFKIMNAADSFNKDVIMINDDEEDNSNNDISAPEIQNLTAVYDSEKEQVIVDCDITLPGGKTVQSVEFTMISPVLAEKCKVSENYYNDGYAVTGQVKKGGRGASLPTNFAGAENGEWVISGISIEDTDGNKYNLDCEFRGTAENFYYYRNEDTDEYKKLSAVKTFTVSGGTPDTSPPVMDTITLSGTALKVTASETPRYARVTYVDAGHLAEEDSGSGYEHQIDGSISGTTVIFNLNSPVQPAGNYYIAMIALTDEAGNSSVYYGYDTTFPFWGATYSDFNFTRFNRSNGDEFPEITGFNVLTFTIGNTTVTGTITLPADLTGNLYYIAVDTNPYGDDGSIGYTLGYVSGTTINYSIPYVPDGTYYIYCVVYATATEPQAAEVGDYLGFLGGFPPDFDANAVVPVSGTVQFNFDCYELIE